MKILISDLVVVVVMAAILILMPESWFDLLFRRYIVVSLLAVYWTGRYVTHYVVKKEAAKKE